MAKRKPVAKKSAKKITKIAHVKAPPLTYSQKTLSDGGVELTLRSFTHKRECGFIRDVGGIVFRSVAFPQWGDSFFLQGNYDRADHFPVTIPQGDVKRVLAALKEYGAVEVPISGEDITPPSPPEGTRVNLKPEPGSRPAPLGTCKGVLEVLDRMACALDSTERRELWDVLTALRGPDTPEVGNKAITTAVIRAKALPLWLSSALNPGAHTADSYLPGEASRMPDQLLSNHFRRHARQAFNALGLTW